MTEYKGYYVDHVSFNSKEEIDEFLKQQAIRAYITACQVFIINKTFEAGLYADELGELLNREYGISWDELEQMEAEAYRMEV